MARGDRNYFRHSCAAHRDHKISRAISLMGKEAYFYYFTLIEVCVGMKDETVQTKFRIHERVLSTAWGVWPQSVHKVLTKLEQCDLLVYTKLEHSCLIEIPNLSKYIGLYATNKIKENKINKNKEKNKALEVSSAVSDIINKREIKKPEATNKNPVIQLVENPASNDEIKKNFKSLGEYLGPYGEGLSSK